MFFTEYGPTLDALASMLCSSPGQLCLLRLEALQVQELHLASGQSEFDEDLL